MLCNEHIYLQVKFDQFVEQGRVLHNYASILELLLRLRQCCDHPFLVMRCVFGLFFFYLFLIGCQLVVLPKDSEEITISSTLYKSFWLLHLLVGTSLANNQLS